MPKILYFHFPQNLFSQGFTCDIDIVIRLQAEPELRGIAEAQLTMSKKF